MRLPRLSKPPFVNALCIATALALQWSPVEAGKAIASPDIASRDGGKVELVTLGTGGGPAVRLNRSQIATALAVNGKLYLVDVGYGAVRQMAAAGMSPKDVDAIFITHHHIDHTADLNALMALRWVFQGFERPMLVAGPPGTTNAVSNLLSANLEIEIARTNNGPIPPRITSVFSSREFPAETPRPELVFSDGTIKVFAMTNTHYHFPEGSIYAQHARSYGLRIETPRGVIAFTGDTGPSKNIEILAKDADVLVSEIIDLDLSAKQLNDWGYSKVRFDAIMEHHRTEHLSAVEVGKLAKAAGAKKVILSHIAPGNADDNNKSRLIEGIRANFDGPVVLAGDLDRFALQ